MPKVSVLVPVYGVEKYIERCARILFEQTLNDIEFIFVDDCTPDRSMEILKSIIEEYQLRFAEKKYEVKTERMPTNSGLAAVRRQGIQLATGDYITFCDSDDIMPEDAVETLYNLAVESGADIVSGDMQMLYDDGTTKRSFISLPYGGDRESVYRALLSREYSHTLCSKLFQNNLLQGHEYITLMHATNGEDGMLFYQVLQHATKAVHLNKVVYTYYQNMQSSTHVRIKEQGLYSIVLLNKIRINTCGKIDTLKNDTWVYVSKVLNGLLAEGYNKDGVLKKIIKEENMGEFILPIKMLRRYSLSDYFSTMSRRVLKPMLSEIRGL